MQLLSIMSHNVKVISPDATIQDAADKMKSLDIGALPVCDGTRLLGMLTDRDITVRAVATGCPPSTPVRDTMTPQIAYCFSDQDVTQAAAIMEDQQIRRVPILSRDKRLVGIVSLGDIATQTGDKKLSGEALQQVSQPTHA